MKNLIFIFCIIFTNSIYSQDDSLYLHLPNKIFTTTTSEYSIYYTNIISSQKPDIYNFTTTCNVGRSETIRYNLDSLDVGVYDLSVSVFDSLYVFLEEESCQIVVTDNSTCHEDTLNILMIGNSLTYAGIYPRYTKQFIDGSSLYPCILKGTRYNDIQDSLDGIFHEGYGGQTWLFFKKIIDSPFVYFDDSQTEVLDVGRYLGETLNNKQPDIITIFLGLNDMASTSCDPTSVETIDEYIDIILQYNVKVFTDSLIAAFPDSKIGISLIPPPNIREEAFYLSLGDSTEAWNRKKKVHRLVDRYELYFNNLGNPNVTVIPVYPNIDTFDGYDFSNALHPNDSGYKQVANSIYGWMKDIVSQIETEQSKTYYVSVSGNDLNDGLSWTTPFVSYQKAYNTAIAGDQVWISEGTYLPTYDFGLVDTGNHFRMKNGIEFYGGFSGSEILLEDRDYSIHETILSGDLGIPNDSTDNAYHVFYHPDGTNLDSTAVLDGFVITKGAARNDVDPHRYGSGFFNWNCNNPILRNCEIRENYSFGYLGGGAFCNNAVIVNIQNCIIFNNTAVNGGNEIYEFYEFPTTITNINNSCYSNSTNDVYGSLVVSNCTTDDPIFIGIGEHPYELSTNSPCIDNGENAYVQNELDINGNLRLLDGDDDAIYTVDMGTYELKIFNSPKNITTNIISNNLVVTWDNVDGASSYDVYSSDDPYDGFTLTETVSNNQYSVPVSSTKLFYYIIAKDQSQFQGKISGDPLIEEDQPNIHKIKKRSLK